MTLKPQYQRTVFRNNARTCTQFAFTGQYTEAVCISDDGVVSKGPCKNSNATTPRIKVFDDTASFCGYVYWN